MNTRSLKSLSEEIVAVNLANGWNVCRPQDWTSPAEDVLKDWRFEDAHFVDSENCQGQVMRYWRVFADRVMPPGLEPKEQSQYHTTKAGCGPTPEQALEQCKKNILNDPIAAYKIPAVLALITSEVSEALEAFRKRDRANFEEEIADVLIRVLDCAHGLGIDLEPVVLAKIEANRNRGFRHGGKVI
jgi:NTP pyrophosphatase (non-canonical NTP hydrolase)